MGAPDSGLEAAEQPTAESLLSAFKTIDPSERRKHASVLNYWLAIRGDKEFPPLHDLDPLEISDAGPCSILFELIGGGHDAEVRHIGEKLRTDADVARIIDAASPSILSCIGQKLPIVAISRSFLAFEDEFAGAEGPTRCWITLLPLSAGGAWVDYVYAMVSVESTAADAAESVDAVESSVAEEREAPAAETAEIPEEAPTVVAAEAEADQPEATEVEDEEVEAARTRPGFSKLIDGLAGLTSFYGHGFKVEPVIPAEPSIEEPRVDLVADEPAVEQPEEEPEIEEPALEEPTVEQATVEVAAVEEDAIEEPPVEEQLLEDQSQNPKASEGPLQTKLAEVRTRADEARKAKLQANVALYEGLGAAYDFALDAEDSPEEYLRLVEAQGLKIQLRSPMTPVVKLAFDGLCDDSTIGQLEAVLAWALAQDLPRGSLAGRIEEAGGIGKILSGESAAA